MSRLCRFAERVTPAFDDLAVAVHRGRSASMRARRMHCRTAGYFPSVIEVNGGPRLLAGRYVLHRELGRGGMATVHEGHDRRLDRRVAVKVVPVVATEPAARQRFVREARSGARLFHPNAVSVFDAGETDGYLYIVMEFVD